MFYSDLGVQVSHTWPTLSSIPGQRKSIKQENMHGDHGCNDAINHD